jgi:hypothetical protein
MENQQLLHSFASYSHGINSFLVFSLIAAVATGLMAWWLNRKQYEDNRDKNLKNVGVMFLGFLFMLACGSGLFKLMSLWSLKPIEIYSHSVKTPYGRAEFKDVKDFFIKPSMIAKSIDPNLPVDSTRFLSIIERRGESDKIHILSEGDYPIDSVFVYLIKALD